MKNTLYFILIVFGYSSLTGMQNNIPAARLEWKPLEDLHITLFSLQPDYAQQNFINKNTRALEALKKQKIKFPLRFPIITLDILVPTKILAGKVFNTSPNNPRGDSTTFNELMITNPPSKKKGKHWYLVLTIEPNENNFTLEEFKTLYTQNFFKNPRNYQFLPHITIAEITKIYDAKTFLDALTHINELFIASTPQTSLEIKERDLIFKTASKQHPRNTIMLEINNQQAFHRIKQIQAMFATFINPK